jgi:hypothetical protein
MLKKAEHQAPANIDTRFVKRLKKMKLDTSSRRPAKKVTEDDLVPQLGLDDRLYTEDDELVPSEVIPSGRQYTF